MHSELRGTDIEWVARGYWGRRFTGRLHPKVKTSWLVALITFVAGVAVLIGAMVDEANTAIVESGPSATTGVAIALVLVGLGFFLKGQFTYEAAQTEFTDHAVAQWEVGNHQIPDAETVEEFINHREVNNGSSKG